jgi:hypothetical protein
MSIIRTLIILVSAAGFVGGAVAQNADPEAPAQVLDQMLYAQAAHMGPEWWQERTELVQSDPAAYAPLIRDRLVSGLPASLEEFSLDDPRWITTRTNQFPSGAALAIMRIVRLLPAQHAEPILQEFFDKLNPLVLEADLRRWQAEDAYQAKADGAEQMMKKVGEYGRLRTARTMGVDAAADLDSAILFDDFLAMLTSDDAIAQATGAAYTRGNLDAIIAWRPDALPEILEATTRLSASDQPRVAEAGRALMDAVRQTLHSPPRDDTRADPPR